MCTEITSVQEDSPYTSLWLLIIPETASLASGNYIDTNVAIDARRSGLNLAIALCISKVPTQGAEIYATRKSNQQAGM